MSKDCSLELIKLEILLFEVTLQLQSPPQIIRLSEKAEHTSITESRIKMRESFTWQVLALGK